MSTSITTTKGRFRGDATTFLPSHNYSGLHEASETKEANTTQPSRSSPSQSRSQTPSNGPRSSTNSADGSHQESYGQINHQKNHNLQSINLQSHHNHHNHQNQHSHVAQSNIHHNSHSSNQSHLHGRPIHNQSPHLGQTQIQQPTHMLSPHMPSPTHPMPYMQQHYYPYQMMYPAMYIPMYPNDPVYQNHMFMMPQQQPYPNVPQSHKKKENKYAAKVSTASNFVPSSMKKGVEDKKKLKEKTNEVDTAASEEKDISGGIKSEEQVQKVVTGAEVQEGSVVKDSTKLVPEQRIQEEKSIEKPIEYPLYFNATQESYKVDDDRSKKVSEKYDRLRGNAFTNPYVVVTRPVTVVDYTSGQTSFVDEGKFNPIQEKKELKKPVNWASMLQGKKKVTPAPTIPTAPFSLKEEAFQPLGLLLLRIMYDPNYSILSDSEEIPLFKVNPRGLTNTGNICYMNLTLQVLIYCTSFNKLLRLIKDKALGLLGTSNTPLLDALIKFFSEFEAEGTAEVLRQFTEPTKPISPDNFYMNLISHEKFLHLKWGQQEDAEEFLGYYLDGLNEEFVSLLKAVSVTAEDAMISEYEGKHSPEESAQFKSNVKGTMRILRNEKAEPSADEWNEVGANKKISAKRTVDIEHTPITMIFGGQFKSVLTIPKAGLNQFSRSITLDPFQHVQLDILDTSLITEGFEHLNEIESISYNEKDKEIEIKKQTFIDNLPEVLIIHLKRFLFHEGIEKLRKKVIYEHELEIPEKVLSTTGNNKYKLIGVVYHHGANAQAGHYTCDVWRSEENEWVRIDDTVLKSVSENEVLNGGAEETIKSAYILMYAKTE